jgi:hypothetical protein
MFLTLDNESSTNNDLSLKVLSNSNDIFVIKPLIVSHAAFQLAAQKKNS